MGSESHVNRVYLGKYHVYLLTFVHHTPVGTRVSCKSAKHLLLRFIILYRLEFLHRHRQELDNYAPFVVREGSDGMLALHTCLLCRALYDFWGAVYPKREGNTNFSRRNWKEAGLVISMGGIAVGGGGGIVWHVSYDSGIYLLSTVML